MSAPLSVQRFDLKQRLSPLLQDVLLGTASTEDLTVAWVEGAAGTRLPRHQHPQAQLTVVISGLVRVTSDSASYEVGIGQAISIPGNTLHEAEILVDAVYLDIFHPTRHDLVVNTSDDKKGSERS